MFGGELQEFPGAAWVGLHASSFEQHAAQTEPHWGHYCAGELLVLCSGSRFVSRDVQTQFLRLGQQCACISIAAVSCLADQGQGTCAVVSFSLITGTTPHSSSLRSVCLALT